MTTIKFNSKSPEYSFLSNMFPHELNLNGITYKCAEAAFQSQKDPECAACFMERNGYEARKMGRLANLRSDWAEVKGYIMGEILRKKFAPGTPLAEALMRTGHARLIEDAPWDSYWGNGRDGRGQNIMGRLLMKIRGELFDIEHPEPPEGCSNPSGV